LIIRRGSLTLVNDGIHPVGIDLVGQLTGKAQNHRPARAVPDTGKGQRTMQAGTVIG
jgi:hypothetical protein